MPWSEILFTSIIIFVLALVSVRYSSKITGINKVSNFDRVCIVVMILSLVSVVVSLFGVIWTHH